MIVPQVAPVRPRATLPRDGTCLLEDEVGSRLADERWGVVFLHGPIGSGKSTALAHLAERFCGDSRLILCERLTDVHLVKASSHLVVCTFLVTLQSHERWELARWTRDDCIEYLLHVHPRACASVVARIHEPDVDLGGVAELWSSVLDQLAADETLTDFRTAIRRELARRVARPAGVPLARLDCLRMITRPAQEGVIVRDWQIDKRLGDAARRWLRHQPVRMLAAAEAFQEVLRAKDWESEYERCPHELIAETGLLVAGDHKVIQTLRAILTAGSSAKQATAAGLLHAAGESCLPLGDRPQLAGARLPGAAWHGADLCRADLRSADLTDADLSEADLRGAEVVRAVLLYANLRGARLSLCTADRAILMEADLSYVRARKASFDFANLVRANLEGALLRDCNFRFADLRGAKLVRANLIGAKLDQADLAGADFTAADLAAADLHQLRLNLATFNGACFDDANLEKCDMEGMILPGASFLGANLRKALLTGTRIVQGQFRDADLRGAALANIDWEGADLRDADFRYSTFHMGSSRSGLVDSPIASEGSRTGFYTDELNEQDFKSPEEIRKANLRGANLRGADVEHTDFYLVDLRDARYSPDQEAHFRRTGAILETRV